MKDELLKEGSYNVIIVNWTDSNQFPYYQAFANGRVVGAQTAKLINLLMENKGITPDSVHLIGHSLGGQVSGWAGERVPGLGRITGLGIKEAIGDMDFYPNGGNSQPGCFYQHNMTYEMTDDVDNYATNSCAHSRANHYFVDSINKCTFIAVECESYERFEKA
ncbi:Inactive pancreatic lipase-related protein 1, partial [Araneus ventricosus]